MKVIMRQVPVVSDLVQNDETINRYGSGVVQVEHLQGSSKVMAHEIMDMVTRPDGHQVVWNGALDRARHQRHQRVPETPRRHDDAALAQRVWAWLARRYPGSYTVQQIRHRMRLTEADVRRALSHLRTGRRVRPLVGRQRQRVTHYQAVPVKTRDQQHARA